MACKDVNDLRDRVRYISFDRALDKLNYYRWFMHTYKPADNYWHAYLCVIVALYRAELFRRTGSRHF